MERFEEEEGISAAQTPAATASEDEEDDEDEDAEDDEDDGDEEGEGDDLDGLDEDLEAELEGELGEGEAHDPGTMPVTCPLPMFGLESQARELSPWLRTALCSAAGHTLCEFCQSQVGLWDRALRQRVSPRYL